MKRDIKSMLLPELTEFIESIGDKKFRAEQIFRWLHSGTVMFDEMTNLPKKLRGRLDDGFYINVPLILDKQISRLDGTIKYLWELNDGNSVESVVMEYSHGRSVCISTQVGCRMGCAFCASAIGGLVRNLTASEMLDQVMFSQMNIGERISNVVLMGIGEPLDNFDNVLRFLTILTHPYGMNIGARHITISTCGIAENIDKLAQYDIQLSLAVSLHAPDDETRSRLMPINAASSVDTLLQACRRYFLATGRRVSYEYAMIDSVNDSPRHAKLLVRKLNGTGSHLNLILLNNVTERGFRASKPESIKAFIEILKLNSVNFTIRRKLGADIDASCGQLRGSRNSGTMGNN